MSSKRRVMKPYIKIIAPGLLDFFGRFSALGVGGIGAITLAPFIISRREMNEEAELHEGIHVAQQLECWLVGTLLGAGVFFAAGIYDVWWAWLILVLGGILPGVGWFYWIYYATMLYWTIRGWKVDYRGLSAGRIGYYLIPFEREAYLYQSSPLGLYYFNKRPPFNWVCIRDDELSIEGETLPEHLYGIITAKDDRY
jgi:MFS family permease